MRRQRHTTTCRLSHICGLLLACYGCLSVLWAADTSIVNSVVFNWPPSQLPFCQDQSRLLDEMGMRVGERFASERTAAMAEAVAKYLRDHAAAQKETGVCLDVKVSFEGGVLVVTVLPAAYRALPVDDVVVSGLVPGDLTEGAAAGIRSDIARRLKGQVTADRLSQLPDYIAKHYQDLARVGCEYEAATRTVHVRAGRRRTVGAVRVEMAPAVSDESWGDDAPFRHRYDEICATVRARAEELNRTGSEKRTEDDLAAELVKVVGAKYYGWGYLDPRLKVMPRYGDRFGMFCLRLAEGPTAKANEITVTAAQGDTPSGEPTGTARIVLGNFRRRHEQLTAEGTVGGMAGGSLTLSAPADYVHRRPWTITASHLRTPEVTIGGAKFDQTTTTVAYRLPPYAPGKPNRSGWRYRWSHEELRPESPGPPLDVNVGLLGGTYLHDPGQFLPDTPPSTRADDGPGAEPLPYQLDLDLASPLLGGDDYFAIAQAETRGYWHLTGKCLLAARAATGYCTSRTPLTEQLTLGGDTVPGLLRGHAPQALRGRHALNANVELRYGLAERLDGVLFVDLASVGDGPNPTHGFVADYGLGFRAAIPVGDAAFPVAVFYGRGDGGSRLGIALSRGF